MLVYVAGEPAGWCSVAPSASNRSSVSATVVLAEHLLPVLRDRFGRHCERLETLEGGRIRVRIAAHTALGVAQELAGWGTAVEVVEPDDVIAELARLGAELVTSYGAHAA